MPVTPGTKEPLETFDHVLICLERFDMNNLLIDCHEDPIDVVYQVDLACDGAAMLEHLCRMRIVI